MLMIHKRFPTRKLYIYGGSAFALGFVSVVSILSATTPLTQRYASLGNGQIDGQAEVISSSDPQPESTADTDNTAAAPWQSAVLGASTTANPMSNDNSASGAAPQQSPAAENTAPAPSAPTKEPVATTPEVEAVDPIIDVPFVPELVDSALDLVQN